MTGTVLVTGGAGFIGSHMVKRLRQDGYKVVVLDNLCNGRREAVLDAELVEGDIGDVALVNRLFTTHDFQGILHFASLILVGESMQFPEKYYDNNTERTKVLINAAVQYDVPFIFSSTAAVYGNPEYIPIDEQHPKHPINPYGDSKWLAEQALEKAHQQYGLRYGALRYFNAAGADPDGELGECHEPETHLIPLVLQAAAGRREAISVFGEDYNTPDGSCIRDYIHIVDLCDAHSKLLDYLQQGGVERQFNLGTGNGYSVKEVIDTVEEVTERKVTRKMEARREGDPAVLVADGSKAQRVLGWQPKRSDLKTLIADAWAWEQSYFGG